MCSCSASRWQHFISHPKTLAVKRRKKKRLASSWGACFISAGFIYEQSLGLFVTLRLHLLNKSVIIPIHPQVFRPGQTTEVTFYIRQVIWSTSGSDYLLNRNKTTHSIFVRKGMERYSSHFTHSLVYDSWVRSWWKSQSQQKARGSQPMMLLSYIRAVHTAGLPLQKQTKETKLWQTDNYFVLNENKERKRRKTPKCCENEFIPFVIKYSTATWLVLCTGLFLMTVYHFNPMLFTAWSNT